MKSNSSTRPWTVSELMAAATQALQADIGACTVQGELGGVTRAASGHCYFTLKDEYQDAAVRCVMFRRAASLLDFDLKEGQVVEMRGRFSIYEPRGDLQLVAESMTRAGAGALYEEFLRRKARLTALGLFDEKRKRPLPAFPRVVGVITSPSGAVFHDVMTALKRRAPHVQIILYPAMVQGSSAPASLIHALQTAAERQEVDVLIVCRGGGSLEDLWAFNDEQLIHAMAASPLPVISAVGHETDVSLSDLVADLRAPTPTAAAELVSPPTSALLHALELQYDRMSRVMEQRLQREAQRLDRAALRLSRPASAIKTHQDRLQRYAQVMQRMVTKRVDAHEQQLRYKALRLKQTVQQQLMTHHHRLAVHSGTINALDPRKIIDRGFVWLTHAETGRAVSWLKDIHVGDQLKVQLKDGQAHVQVNALSASKDR